MLYIICVKITASYDNFHVCVKPVVPWQLFEFFRTIFPVAKSMLTRLEDTIKIMIVDGEVSLTQWTIRIVVPSSYVSIRFLQWTLRITVPSSYAPSSS